VIFEGEASPAEVVGYFRFGSELPSWRIGRKGISIRRAKAGARDANRDRERQSGRFCCKVHRRPLVSDYFTVIGTDADTFSQARVSFALLPPSSVSVYFRSSTSAPGFAVLMGTRPRSWSLLYVRPHCPVCLLMMSCHLAGSLRSTYKV